MEALWAVRMEIKDYPLWAVKEGIIKIQMAMFWDHMEAVIFNKIQR
jgi:hypothetical protein